MVVSFSPTLTFDRKLLRFGLVWAGPLLIVFLLRRLSLRKSFNFDFSKVVSPSCSPMKEEGLKELQYYSILIICLWSATLIIIQKLFKKSTKPLYLSYSDLYGLYQK